MKTRVTILGILSSFGILVLESCNPCSYGVQNEIRSPSGKLVATIYQADCGATTDFATAVSIRPSSDRFSASKNVALGVAGQAPLSASWQSDTELTVAIPPRTEIRVQKDEINGVTIHYQLSE